MPKNKINTLLEQKTVRPVIRRGGDFEFSAVSQVEPEGGTEEVQQPVTAEPQKSAKAEQQKVAQPKSKVGWAIDTELLKAIKIAAVQQGKSDYEVVEEAIALYLQHGKSSV